MTLPLTQPYDVVIVGGGFCGTMVAVHLLRAQKGLRIALVERTQSVGRGLAYSTPNPKHLLNVAANKMGAFAESPEHFYQWLQAHPEKLSAVGFSTLQPDAYVPRLLFGDYLQNLLFTEQKTSAGLTIIYDEIVDIVHQKKGNFLLKSKEKRHFEATHIVLAIGNFPPNKIKEDKNNNWFHNNPYSAEICALLAQSGDVLIIGTGLTSLDVLLTLAPIKQEGKIHFISRRGLFPQIHRIYEPYFPFLDPCHLPQTARSLLHRIRQELRKAAEKKKDWRAVLDSLRPFTQIIWEGFPPDEQKRFLRHLEALWNVHRHRCAPEIMEVKNQLEALGRIVCHCGYIKNFQQVGEQVEITYRPRGIEEKRTFTVRHVLSCTGPQPDYRKLDDTLVCRLLEQDLLASDPLHMGAYTTDGGRVCRNTGEPILRLYTLGSPQKGRLFESVAIPELREQAATLADHILNDFTQKK